MNEAPAAALSIGILISHDVNHMPGSELIQPLATLPYHQRRHDEFRDGLYEGWAEQYPDLFDDDDLRLARSQAHLGYQFFTWYSAIMLHQATGLLSLIEKYQFSRHERKQQVVRKVVPDAIAEMVLDRAVGAGAQCPDLFLYSSDGSEWFFCEVKGPRDKLRIEQTTFFEELAIASGRPVFIVELQKLTLG